MTGEFIVSKLKNISSIEGADNINQANMFGETVIIPKAYKEGNLGILFDCESALSHEYAHYNNLYRDKTLNSNPDVTGFFEPSRRVRPIKLKGVKCSAMWMPLESIKNIPELNNTDLSGLTEGIQSNVVGGVEICSKYVVKTDKTPSSKQGGKVKANLVPTFKEHMDTDQFMRNTNKVQPGSYVVVTEKLHGTSGRCGYLPVIKYDTSFKSRVSALLYGLSPFNKENLKYEQYDFVVGSRRVLKTIGNEKKKYKNNSQGTAYYEGENVDLWTKVSKELFEGKLEKGETVYFEIVGYTPEGTLIMGSASNKKLEKFLDKKKYKEFITKYGPTTEFTYGCKPGEYKVFVYRITMTNEDGVSYDLTWEQVKNRCEQLGVNHVNELFIYHMKNTQYLDINAEVEWLTGMIETYAGASSEMFPEQVREGVVVRNTKVLFLKYLKVLLKIPIK